MRIYLHWIKNAEKQIRHFGWTNVKPVPRKGEWIVTKEGEKLLVDKITYDLKLLTVNIEVKQF